MNKLELMKVIADAHQPELTEQPEDVYELWEDGEITLTKSGSLYRQRGLHTMVAGMLVGVPVSMFPDYEPRVDELDRPHAHIVVASEAIGMMVRKAMREWICASSQM